MKLLIKFPTRGRKEKFFQVLDLYVDYLEDIDNYKVIVSCDNDDLSMNNDEVINKLNTYKNLEYYFSDNKSKIEAINANLENQEFDILLLASDDMIPQFEGYDMIIRAMMMKNYPDTDGVLWFNDGYQAKNLNTLCILGKKYYDRFGYIYHPSYISLWSDNEFTEVAQSLNKQTYIPQVIIKHEHPVWKGEKWDDVQVKNDSFNNTDKENFIKRKENSFKL
jgi:hypothetical protein